MAEELEPGAIPVRERITLGEKWEEYSRRVVPALASPVQREETRRAFYGGAASMFDLFIGETDAGVEPTQLDMEYAAALMAELLAYARSLRGGRSWPAS